MLADKAVSVEAKDKVVLAVKAAKVEPAVALVAVRDPLLVARVVSVAVRDLALAASDQSDLSNFALH